MVVAKRINIQRLQVVRMDAASRRVFDAFDRRSSAQGRPRMRWQNQFKEALTSLDVTNRRRRAQSRGWREALRQAETL